MDEDILLARTQINMSTQENVYFLVVSSHSGCVKQPLPLKCIIHVIVQGHAGIDYVL